MEQRQFTTVTICYDAKQQLRKVVVQSPPVTSRPIVEQPDAAVEDVATDAAGAGVRIHKQRVRHSHGETFITTGQRANTLVNVCVRHGRRDYR